MMYKKQINICTNINSADVEMGVVNIEYQRPYNHISIYTKYQYLCDLIHEGLKEILRWF